MQMPTEMLTAIKAHLVDPERAWKVKAVNVHRHTETVMSVVEGVPTSTEVEKRQVTITVQSDVMGRILLLTLDGPGSGAFESGVANLLGNTFAFDDAGLLNWCLGVETAWGPIATAALMQSFFGPIPVEPDDEEGGDDNDEE